MKKTKIQKKKITTGGIVVGFSKDTNVDFCWFVRHPKINKGQPTPTDRGDLEATMNKYRKKIIK